MKYGGREYGYTWMMKRVMGFEVLKTLGSTPSKMPPWGGALVAVGFTEVTVAVTVDRTVVVIVAMTRWVRARAHRALAASSDKI